MTSSFKLPQAVIQAFEKVPDLYLILSPELQVLTASDAFLAATRTVREKITGKSISQMLSDSSPGMEADSMQQLVCSLQQVLRTRQPHRLELQQYYMPAPAQAGCNVNEYRTVLNSPVLDDQGQVQYIIHKVEDVTERGKAEQEFHQSRQLLKTTIDSSLDMIQVFEAVRDEGGEIIDFRWILNNQTSEKIYGDVVGKNLLEHNPGVVDVGIFNTFKRVVETGISDQSERHYVHEQFDGWFYQSTVKLGDGVATTTKDISKRKQAEQELINTKESLQAFQEQLQMVLANTASSIMLLRPIPDETNTIYDFEYLYTNDQLLKSVNRTALVGRRFTEEFPGVKGTELFQHYTRVANEGGTWSGEAHIDFDGFDAWAQVYATRVKGNLLVTYFGITERRKAEEALLQSKELIQTVFDVSLNPIAYHKAVRDASGKIIDFEFQLENKTASKYAVSDRTGKRYSEAYPGIRDTTIFKKYCEVVETGRKLDEEVQINLKGKDLWFHLQGVKMDDGLVATAVDITERKKSEQEILRLKDEIAQKATDKYQALFNTMDEGLSVIEMIYDADGKPVDLRLLEVNPAYEKITGLKNVAGKLGSEIVPSEQYWLDAYDSVVKTGKPLRYENYHAGARQWYRTHTSRIGGPGSHVIANLFEDITERKQRELHQEFLLQFSDTLRIESAPDAVAHKAIQMLIEQLGLDRSYIVSYYLDEDRAALNYQIGNDTVPPLPDHFVLSDYPEALKATLTGTLVIEDELERQGLSEAERSSSGRLGMRAMVAATLHKGENRSAWSMVAINARPRQWTPGEIRLVEEVAERTWAAIERAKAEEALRESRARFATLFSASPVPFMVLTPNAPDYTITAANEAYFAATLTSPETLIGRRLFDVFPDDPSRPGQLGSEALALSLEKVLDTKRKDVMPRVRYDIITPGGGFEPHWWEAINAPMLDANGDVTAIIHQVSRVTELELAEEKERQQQEKQALLLKFSDVLREETNPDALVIRALQMLADHLQLDRCHVGVYLLAEDLCEFPYQVGNDRVPPMPTEGLPISGFPDALRVASDETLVISDFQNAEGLTETDKRNFEALGFGAAVIATVRKGEHHPLWSIAAVSATPRHWTSFEIQLLEEATELTWAAVERARAEEALVKSEEKYRTLFDSMDEGYCIIQLLYNDAGAPTDFRYLQVNRAFEQNTGLHEAEGKTIRELAPDIEPKWMEIYDQVAKTRLPRRFEEASEALHHIFSLYAFPFGDPSEHKVAVIFSDITEHKKAQEALRESEQQFRLLVTASSDIIYKLNADWSRMEMLTGKNFLPDTQEPIDSWVEVYVPEAERALVRAAIQEAVGTKSEFKLEHRVNKADGSVGWVASRAIPVTDEKGNVREWFGTASDITLRKQAEQQLHDLNESLEHQVAERTHELNESKLFAEQITEATPDFIMIFNLLTNKVEFVNQGPYVGNKDRFHETLLIDYDQLMRRSHPEDRKKLHEFIERFRTVSDQAAHTLEYRVVDRDKTIWYRSRGKVFRRDETGKPTHFISVVQDISDLKQLEQENLQMRLDQQRDNLLVILEAQEEERRRFSEALHNGIGQILYSAKLQLGQYLGQRHQKSGASDPIRQVDKILDEAIRQTRGLSHQLTPALLEQFGLETAFQEMGNSLSSPSLQLQCLVYNLPKQLDKHLQLVVYRVAQEMANNIIRHSNATEASLLLRGHRQSLVLIAEDNGRGFDPTLSRKKGIGLSSIKNRVELMNGTLSINTAPGQGTQVKITLPLLLA